MISKEYGWTDEQIHNLTLRRLRQVTAAIRKRQYADDRRERTMVSWQTRTLAMFVAGGYMTDGKHENPGIKAAGRIAIDEIEKLQIEELEENPPVKENEAGTFERFMGSMADPRRWAGR